MDKLLVPNSLVQQEKVLSIELTKNTFFFFLQEKLAKNSYCIITNQKE